jgi:hypothetical protein
MLTKAEERELRTLRPKGLTLLGFKPASCLKDSHQLAPSRCDIVLCCCCGCCACCL